jgi:protein tyrosine phosphatase
MGLTTLLPSMSRLSKQCGILNISEPYRPPWPVMGIVLLFVYSYITYYNSNYTFLFAFQPVGVHCRMGQGRTGVMSACFLVHFYDQSPEQAITNVRLLRPGSVETYEQEKAVVRYHDYLRSL